MPHGCEAKVLTVQGSHDGGLRSSPTSEPALMQHECMLDLVRCTAVHSSQGPWGCLHSLLRHLGQQVARKQQELRTERQLPAAVPATNHPADTSA